MSRRPSIAPGARRRSGRRAGSVQARWHERIRQWFADHRRGGRLPRAARRTLAAALVIAAGILAVSPNDTATGQDGLAFTRDLPIGARLEARDIEPVRMPLAPDGALIDADSVIGSRLAAAVRRGETVTDVRLAAVTGPDPGPGRVAVPILPADPTVVDLLGPGMHVAVLSVGQDAAAVVLAPDAVVLTLVAAAQKSGGDRPVVVAVPTDTANAVVAANIAGTVAIRFT